MAGRVEAKAAVVAKLVEVVIVDEESCRRRRLLHRRHLRLHRRHYRRLRIVIEKGRDCPVAFRLEYAPSMLERYTCLI